MDDRRMEPPKREFGRRAQLKDFAPGLDGKYYYTGTVYAYTEKNARSFKAEAAFVLILSIVSMGCLIGAGCLKVPGMLHNPLVIVPYGFSLGLSIAQLWAAVKLVDKGHGKTHYLREYIYKETIDAIPVRAAATCIGDVVTLIVWLVIVFQQGTEEFSLIPIFIYPIFLVISAFLSLSVRKSVKNEVWET